MLKSEYEVIVIGGGHAGIEAGLAAARLKASTLMITFKEEGVGQMSCNPSIGGLGKGHLVKEIDALGGVMGEAIDAAGIHFRQLNSSKGPAVRASRAQADRKLYCRYMLGRIKQAPFLTLLEGEAGGIVEDHGVVQGVRLADGSFIGCRAVVVTTGTFLRGLMHTGSEQSDGGRLGDGASNALSRSLEALGFSLMRLKTGTPPRLRRSSIDYSRLVEQPGDIEPIPFSIITDAIKHEQISCWMSETNEGVHDLIRANRERSPLFNGQIKSGGPRYCPSIEDKVFRFPDKDCHHIFLEPEGYDSDLVYPNGISTSLPKDVQEGVVKNIRGLERAEIVRYGYAIEYDAIDARMLGPTLESKDVGGLFFAGQINGTSGYEEAAGQGLVAGANAALKVQGKKAFSLLRNEAYVGVMIDDLVTRGVDEPYRMFTSRAEYRLMLREDNAFFRLSPLASRYGLLDERRLEMWEKKNSQYLELNQALSTTKLKASAESNAWLLSVGSSELKATVSLREILKRPELDIGRVLERFLPEKSGAEREILRCLETEIKFEGYLKQQEEEIRRLERMEGELIPKDFAYDNIPGLRVEFREKLKRCRPFSLGQARRIPGMTSAALSLLAVELKRGKARAKFSA